jgi:endoglucanase
MMKKILENLSNVPGPSSFEQLVREQIKVELGSFGRMGAEVCQDILGNLIIKREGDSDAPIVMLDAHMDECGFIVKYIDDDGFLYFDELGGLYGQTLLNQKVKFGNGCKGVIGSKPPHVMDSSDSEKAVKIEDLFIDIGAADKEEAESLVNIGDWAVFDTEFDIFNNKFAMARNLDNRIGCAIMVKALLETNSKATIYGVGAMEEETGLIGSRPAAFNIAPDIAIVLDTTIAGDHPNIDIKKAPVKCGAGPVLVLKDGYFMPNRQLVEKLKESARLVDVKYQVEVNNGGTTDAGVIRFQREGISTANISVATRYIHSPVSMANLQDIEDAAKILIKFLDNI